MWLRWILSLQRRGPRTRGGAGTWPGVGDPGPGPLRPACHPRRPPQTQGTPHGGRQAKARRVRPAAKARAKQLDNRECIAAWTGTAGTIVLSTSRSSRCRVGSEARESQGSFWSLPGPGPGGPGGPEAGVGQLGGGTSARLTPRTPAPPFAGRGLAKPFSPCVHRCGTLFHGDGEALSARALRA